MRIFLNRLFLVMIAATLFVSACNKDNNTAEPLTETNPSVTGYGVFSVNANGDLVMNGTAVTNTPYHFDNIIRDNPNAKLLIMQDCPGSDDDEANLLASRKIRKAGLSIHVTATSELASGAVDMFFAGVKRTMEPGAKFGVHSWSDGTNEATDFPKGHANHQPYISYFKEMGLTQQESEDFYYFTIYAADADNIHWMTQAEIDKYKLLN
jgi:hypothetical protein